MNISVSLPQIGWTFAGFATIAIVLFILFLIGTAFLHFMCEDDDMPVLHRILVGAMVIVVIVVIAFICIGAYNLGDWLHKLVGG